MPEQPAERLAQTSVPIHPPIAARWSPRAFDPDAQVTTDEVAGMLEAARWAATWGGRQPVRFMVGLRRDPGDQSGDQSDVQSGDDTFDTLAGLLSRGNAYAKVASALILVCADQGEDSNTALYAAVDAGAAEANLIIEAVSRGLICHPMAGFDIDGSRTAFGIPAEVLPLMIIAVGHLGDYAGVDPQIAERDARPRARMPLDEIAFRTVWGRPWRD